MQVLIIFYILELKRIVFLFFFLAILNRLRGHELNPNANLAVFSWEILYNTNSREDPG
jgi:hypothetical protein